MIPNSSQGCWLSGLYIMVIYIYISVVSIAIMIVMLVLSLLLLLWLLLPSMAPTRARNGEEMYDGRIHHINEIGHRMYPPNCQDGNPQGWPYKVQYISWYYANQRMLHCAMHQHLAPLRKWQSPVSRFPSAAPHSQEALMARKPYRAGCKPQPAKRPLWHAQTPDASLSTFQNLMWKLTWCCHPCKIGFFVSVSAQKNNIVSCLAGYEQPSIFSTAKSRIQEM